MDNQGEMPQRSANLKVKARKSAGLGLVRAMFHAKAHSVLAELKALGQQCRKCTGKISPEQV